LDEIVKKGQINQCEDLEDKATHLLSGTKCGLDVKSLNYQR